MLRSNKRNNEENKNKKIMGFVQENDDKSIGIYLHSDAETIKIGKEKGAQSI